MALAFRLKFKRPLKVCPLRSEVSCPKPQTITQAAELLILEADGELDVRTKVHLEVHQPPSFHPLRNPQRLATVGSSASVKNMCPLPGSGPLRVAADRMASGFRVSDCGFRVSVFGRRVPGFGFQVPNSGFQDPGSRFQIPGSGFRVLSSGFRVPASGFRVSGFGLRVSGRFWM